MMENAFVLEKGQLMFVNGSFGRFDDSKVLKGNKSLNSQLFASSIFKYLLNLRCRTEKAGELTLWNCCARKLFNKEAGSFGGVVTHFYYVWMDDIIRFIDKIHNDICEVAISISQRYFGSDFYVAVNQKINTKNNGTYCRERLKNEVERFGCKRAHIA